MKVQPRTEREIQEMLLLPDGEYDFEVSAAVDKLSKAGNPMMEVDLKVYRPDGRVTTVRDWLLSTDDGAYKLRSFAASIHVLSAYESGDMAPEDVEHRAGRCVITTRKDTTGQYPDRNGVKKYLAPNGAAPSPKPRARDDIDDEIPF